MDNNFFNGFMDELNKLASDETKSGQGIFATKRDPKEVPRYLVEAGKGGGGYGTRSPIQEGLISQIKTYKEAKGKAMKAMLSPRSTKKPFHPAGTREIDSSSKSMVITPSGVYREKRHPFK